MLYKKFVKMLVIKCDICKLKVSEILEQPYVMCALGYKHHLFEAPLGAEFVIPLNKLASKKGRKIFFNQSAADSNCFRALCYKEFEGFIYTKKGKLNTDLLDQLFHRKFMIANYDFDYYEDCTFTKYDLKDIMHYLLINNINFESAMKLMKDKKYATIKYLFN